MTLTQDHLLTQLLTLITHKGCAARRLIFIWKVAVHTAQPPFLHKKKSTLPRRFFWFEFGHMHLCLLPFSAIPCRDLNRRRSCSIFFRHIKSKWQDLLTSPTCIKVLCDSVQRSLFCSSKNARALQHTIEHAHLETAVLICCVLCFNSICNVVSFEKLFV